MGFLFVLFYFIFVVVFCFLTTARLFGVGGLGS